MARVLLVQPHQNILKKGEKKRLECPFNLVCLGTAIEEAHNVKIYDRNIYEDDSRFLKFLEKYRPQIIGMTSMTSQCLFDILHLSGIIKKNFKEMVIVVGGIHATVEPESVLNEKNIDFIIRGEGEAAFLEFCDVFDREPKKLGKLQNVNYNSLRPLLEMDELKNPNYNLVELDKYDHLQISFSRGCPGNCTFCYNAKMWGKNGHPFVRMYGPEKSISIFREIIEKYKKNIFTIADDHFITSKSRTEKVCEYLKDKNAHFLCFGRADYINEDIIKILKKAGCHTIQLGIESGSQRMLDFLNKGTTVEQNEQAIRCCERNDVICDASVMMGITTETLEELNKTKDLIERSKPSCPDAQIFNPLPGTKIFDLCVREGKIKKPETLEEWANWTGDITSIGKIEHNTSEISDEDILRISREIMRKRVIKNKVKKAWYWTRKREIRQLLKSAKGFIKVFGSRYAS